ncbi:MAG: cation diffusion facilitator family transporter [Candidatus Omnitrophica bacterium]|nr:cation diffusion facilitator family transporter [Candidatus Omnitrophota bacterium]
MSSRIQQRYFRSSYLVSWISIIVNALLVAVKFFVGFRSHSISILSDAAHSLSDFLSTLIILVSLSISRKPPDREHPFGHGRAEDVGGLLLSCMLIFVGLGFFQRSFARLLAPAPVEITPFFILLILGTAAVKLALGIFTQKVSKDIVSPILETDAAHHYSDVLTSVAVAAGLIAVARGYLVVDAVLGLAISFMIIFWALKIGREFCNNLIGRSAEKKEYSRIYSAARSFPEVRGVTNIDIHSYGRIRMAVIHVEVDAGLSLPDAHRVADAIEKKVCSHQFDKCVVHVDLRSGGQPKEHRRIAGGIHRIVRAIPKIRGFHRLRILSSGEKKILHFHLELEPGISLNAAHGISHRVSEALKKRFGFTDVYIHLEPTEQNGSGNVAEQ